MPAPNFAPADFVAALQALLPRGRVWPTDPDSTLTATLEGLAPTLSRTVNDAAALLVDAFPATAVNLLPEWEQTLGLPDPCAGESPTLQQRQAQVVARLVGTGGQSVAFYEGFAAALGYTVTIQRFSPFRCGGSTAGMACGDPAWAYAWAVVAPANTVTRFRAGRSTAGEPLAVWGNAVLECQFAEINPAHTALLFEYL